MHSKEYFVSKLTEAVLEYNDSMVEEIARDALNAGIDPAYLIEHGLNVAMKVVGEMFSNGELYLPHVIAASEAMNIGVSILLPSQAEYMPVEGFKGTVILGTIEGDIHSIGKDIVAASLRISGYKVIDLGIDVPVQTFVEYAMKLDADVIGTSALMNTTMVNQQILEGKLREAGIRDDIKTMVGGNPVTSDWARTIGADIYGENAADVVEKLNSVVASGDSGCVLPAGKACSAVPLDS